MAQYSQFSPNSFRTFFHSGQPPVPVTPGPHNFRIDSFAIVAYQHPQMARRVFQLDLNASCPGVLKGIGKRLASDEVNFVTDYRSQWPRCTLNNNAKFDFRADREFLPYPRQRLLKIQSTSGRAEAADRIASLFYDV